MVDMLWWLSLPSLLGLVSAEDGLQGWLRYAPLPNEYHHNSLPSSLVVLNRTQGSPVYTAGQELQQALLQIFGKKVATNAAATDLDSSIVVGTVDQYRNTFQGQDLHFNLTGDAFSLSVQDDNVHILGQNERGALYGAFEYLSMLAQGNFSNVEYITNPAAPIRWTNEWDNMDSTIERGFAGKSIFFEDGHVRSNLTRAADYARLLASIRVNAVVVNNVNANYTTLKPDNIEGLGRIADVFRPYGIQLGMSLYFASPANLSVTDTYDPLDASVINFWHNVTDQIYERIPDMAGYLVKANSEGQPGPLHYNRTLAEGANLFARALKPHGGVLMFRAFVYDQLNESDWKADRAKAAVDYFKPLDGDFDDNVVVQIKYGPIDFQVREPVSPLFANLRDTNTAIELQVAQEYLGQQCHLVYLPPLWKTITDFDLRLENDTSLTQDVFTGKHLKRPLGDMSMRSWPAYENYTGNLGVQTLTDILYTHFGPNPQTQDNTGWGQWTRADKDSIGMDRTIWNGTGYSGQYPPQVAAQYEDVSSTPEDLILWFHHLPYDHQLKSGKTIIQHFYDAHVAGAITAHDFLEQWRGLKGLIDDERFEHVLFRLEFQAGHSIVWRDAITNFYHNLSGIPDLHGNVGFHPHRLETEKMELNGYKLYTVSPFEAASNYTAVVTSSNTTSGTARMEIPFDDGTYDLAVAYFDMYGGNSTYTVSINDVVVGNWTADTADTGKLGHTPSVHIDGHSATRITYHGVSIKKGDVLKIVGQPDGIEPAPLDYVVLLPPGVVD
ncbi:hypothetical protein AC579_4003 [Pseudocercospora musae]|uniref:Uncharacterized protein n=1 Tax=Pseudocercospora musae TaxID=113226 RepID=A0A139IHQ4_9PEZI|nr:hypothetical protein AC579_4003 [Pseudocercospora musae]KXT14337.1 hypothetical protein AC579_4003 [Pseudocercospora musae]